MVKLIVVIMGQNCEKFIKMCLESVKDADALIYLDGGSTDNTKKIAQDFLIKHKNIAPASVVINEWNSEDKQMNGKQRNFYLNILKTGKQWKDYWCLVLDADEVCDNIQGVKDFIQTAEAGLYSPVMRHFIGSLGQEDATQKKHGVLNRLFKISEAKVYPLESHPVLIGNMKGLTDCCTIWHLGHLPVEYMYYIQKRYKEHEFNSIIHSKQFLKQWRDAHLFGAYPTSQINPLEIPRIILDNFGIDFDELYFRDRREMKAQHYQDAIDWKNYFGCKINRITLLGCGFGQRVKILNNIGMDAAGIELSKYAINNTCSNEVIQGDVIDYELISDVTIAYDVLEHLKYEDLDKTIDNIIKNTNKKILVSVPFKGTPNCDADPTHVIKEDKDWWIKKFIDKGLKLIKTPSHFQYKEQILIFKKGGEE